MKEILRELIYQLKTLNINIVESREPEYKISTGSRTGFSDLDVAKAYDAGKVDGIEEGIKVGIDKAYRILLVNNYKRAADTLLSILTES